MDTENLNRKIDVKGFIGDFNNRFCRLLDTITQRK
jgi:vacuolar protein sorting-associated protein 33A